MKVVRAKKYLGQHFLNDINIAKRTTDLLKKRENQNILEIGRRILLIWSLVTRSYAGTNRIRLWGRHC